MKINFNVEDAVNLRSSVRNYDGQKIDDVTMGKIQSFIQSIENPFGNKIKYHLINIEEMKEPKKLGTYGVIQGAKQFIGVTVRQEPSMLEALGYELEVLMLYLATLRIGTCWLGGTFNRKEFAKGVDIKEDELFPVITPLGYAAKKMHFTEVAMRKLIKADQRKGFESLFFKESFKTPLTKESAENMYLPLEMIRLGPSASNKQPWRIVQCKDYIHFFESKNPGYSKAFSYDIQKIDLGIAAAHFDLSIKELGIQGHFVKLSSVDMELPEHVEYVFSWKKDELEN